MKKKVLSLALALALCLGLTVPAFAVGETTVKDEMGLEYTLSKPVLGTKTHQADEMLSHYSKENTLTVYLVPKGTVIKPVMKPGDQSDSEARKFTGEDQGEQYFLSYEIFDTSGQGGENMEEEGFELAWPGVQPVISRFDWAISVGGNAGTTSWTSSAVCFEMVEEEPPAASAPADPTNDTLTCNGALQSPTVYKINGSNYFKIRDLAAILNGTDKQFSVGYDAALSSVTATTGQGYEKQPGDLAGAPAGGQKTAAPSNDAIYVNGEKITAEVYKIDGSNYFKLRDLGKALDFYVGWSQEAGVFIQTDKPYSE